MVNSYWQHVSWVLDRGFPSPAIWDAASHAQHLTSKTERENNQDIWISTLATWGPTLQNHSKCNRGIFQDRTHILRVIAGSSAPIIISGINEKQLGASFSLPASPLRQRPFLIFEGLIPSCSELQQSSSQKFGLRVIFPTATLYKVEDCIYSWAIHLLPVHTHRDLTKVISKYLGCHTWHWFRRGALSSVYHLLLFQLICWPIVLVHSGWFTA